MKNRFLLISIFIIVIVNIVAYSKTAKYDFVNFDDPGYTKLNPMIKELNAGNLKKMFTEPYISNYQPLMHLSLSIDYRLYGLDAGGYHITNTILHTINSLLVVLLIYLITKNGWISLIIALLFSLHPIQVESVAWITERKGLLCAFFYFLSFITYISFSRDDKKSFYYISIVLFLMALLSKPMAVTFPIILILFDYYEDKLTVSKLVEKIPFFVLSGIFSIITVLAQRQGEAINVKRTQFLFKNILSVFYNVGFYVEKLLIPLKLSAYYEYFSSFDYFASKEFYISALVIALLIAYLLNFKKIRREINFGVLLFLISLIPIIRLVPIGNTFAADRYMYIPMIGFFFAIVMLIDTLTVNKAAAKKVATALFGVYLVFLTGLTYARLEVWRDGHVLITDILKSSPDSKYVRYYYNESVLNLAKSHLNKNEFQKAREYYYVILDFKDNRETLKDQKDVLNYKEGQEEYLNNRLKEIEEESFYDTGMSYLYENDLKSAKPFFDTLVNLYPDHALGYMQLGNISDVSGRFDEADKYYVKSLKLAPDNPYIHYNYAVFLENIGNAKEAARHYKLAVEFNADWELPKKALMKLQENK